MTNSKPPASKRSTPTPISPWHLCRQHLFAVARVVKRTGIREVSRRAKMAHSVVARFATDPTAVQILSVYAIMDAVGYQFSLKSPAKQPRTEKRKTAAT